MNTTPPDRSAPAVRWNTTALVAGLVFVLLGVLFLLEALEVVELRAAIAIPVLLIGLGIAVLLGGRPGGE